MSEIRQCIRVAWVLALGLMLMGAASAQKQDAAAAKKIFMLLNQERTAKGLSPLAWSDKLAGAAVDHTKLMAAKDELSHQFDGEAAPDERVGSRGIGFVSLGENVAMAPTAEQAHDGLMHSPHHRANILDKNFDAVGVIVIAKEGQLYITQEFARLAVELSENEACKTVLERLNLVRQQKGREPLTLMSSPAARHAAVCAMAKSGKPASDALMSLEKDDPAPLGAGAFLVADFAQFSDKQFSGLTKAKGVRVRIDLCRAAGPQGSAPMWWGVITLYQ